MLTKYGSTKRAGWLALSFILSTGMILTTLPVAYAVPMMTNYQGTLKDSKGKLLNNSVVTLTFAVYEVPASGTALWTETHSGVSVKDGAFSVVLGSVVNIPESVAEGERYLGVTVNTDAEMTPRQALVSGFFAMRAGVAESVAAGSVSSDKLGAAAVTSEKVADSAVTTTKLAPTAVTGDKLAVDSVTTDKIANGAVTTEKLSTEVQEKLAQGSSMPATVTTPVTMTTLNVTEKLKVGKNSLYLGSSTTPTGTDNSIYTDGSDLLVQSDPTEVFNTVINANNAGKVGIGTSNPKMKLEVWDTIKISSKDAVNQYEYENEGLFMTYDGKLKQGEILAHTNPGYSNGNYVELQLAGSPVVINNNDWAPYNVGIGTKTPKAKLDVAGTFLVSPAPLSIPGEGLHMFYTTPSLTSAVTVPTAEIGAYNGGYQKLTITGNPLILNESGNGNDRNVGIGTTTPRVKLDVRADPPGSTNTTALWVSNNDATDWGYNTIFKVTRDNTKAIAVRKEKAEEWSGPETFVVYGSGAVWANGSWRWSDKRWKENIKPLQNTLDKVVKLQGVSYKWNKKTHPTNDDRTHIGFVAQEVETVLPEMVSTDEKGFKAVAYDEMTAVLVEAVKELKAQNDALKTIVCKDHPEEAICK